MSAKRPQISDRERGRCAVDGLPGADAHHRWMRSHGGPDTYANQIFLCRACHDWAHHHPGAAQVLGLILAATGTDPVPSVITVPYFDPPHGPPWPSWALLDEDTDKVLAVRNGPRWDEGSPPLTPLSWLAAR